MSREFRGGRRYDLALGLTGPGARTPVPDDDDTVVAAPKRAPVGSAMIRPSVPARARAEAVSQELLETTADSVLLVAEPDGSTSFDVSISDELFDELACRITLKDKRVVAVFRVRDANTRRLLEAEAGRLRVQLEARGLTVDEVRVVQE